MSKPATKPKRIAAKEQHAAFVAMAREVGADETPGALDRAFGKIAPKKLPKAPAKSK